MSDLGTPFVHGDTCSSCYWLRTERDRLTAENERLRNIVRYGCPHCGMRTGMVGDLTECELCALDPLSSVDPPQVAILTTTEVARNVIATTHRVDLIEDAISRRLGELPYVRCIRIHPALLAAALGEVYAVEGMPVETWLFGLPVVVDLQCPGMVVT